MRVEPLMQGIRGAVIGGILATMAVVPSASQAFGRAPIDSDRTVALAELPENGQITYALISKGGPFAFEKDGATFGNFERILPRMQRGYYREYTVRTPGYPGRGAKRIVCGGWVPQTPDACYYSHDHYASFRKIVE
jgi:ribonuclease T1